MRGLLRTVLVALILALTAGMVLHATRAAAMAAAPSVDMQMPGCDGCGDGGDNPGSTMDSCAALCATPPVAPPAAGSQVGASAPAAAEPAPGTPTPAGLTGPPDHPPPRTIVLS